MKDKTKKGILSFAGNYKYLTYLGCTLAGISAVLVMIPFLCIWKIAYECIQVAPDMSQAENLTTYGWMAVAFSIGGIVVYVLALVCTHLAAFRTARNMRSKALHHMVKLPLGYFNANGSGKLRNIINESSGQTETYLAHNLPDMVAAVVTPVAMLVFFAYFDIRLGLLSLIPVVISMFFMSNMSGSALAGAMKEYQNALEDMNNEAVEYVRGVPVVKTFGQTVYSFKNFHDAIIRYKDWAVNYTIKLRIPMCGFTVAINAVFALLIPAGILLIASAADPKKFLSDFIFYLIFTPLMTVVMNKIMFASEDFMLAKDAALRIHTILEEKPLTDHTTGDMPKKMDITFDNVSFSYPGANKKAVDHVSLHIEEGQTVALVGPSGGGKSTIASLIPRFYDVKEGSVRIGGIDVRQLSSKTLMSLVSFVFQSTSLFKMSLYDNIRFSRPDATREEVIRAAKAAQCEEIFAKFPEGIDTVVGTKGVYLSGGEAQRIALARAILKDAPIVLLDEATAFADPENEYLIQRALDELTKGKTVLMVAHRLSTIQNANQIILLSDGKVEEQGNHFELLERKGRYSRMWKEYESNVSWKVKEAM